MRHIIVVLLKYINMHYELHLGCKFDAIQISFSRLNTVKDISESFKCVLVLPLWI